MAVASVALIKKINDNCVNQLVKVYVLLYCCALITTLVIILQVTCLICMKAVSMLISIFAQETVSENRNDISNYNKIFYVLQHFLWKNVVSLHFSQGSLDYDSLTFQDVFNQEWPIGVTHQLTYQPSFHLYCRECYTILVPSFLHSNPP